jgi:hypothetical protein
MLKYTNSNNAYWILIPNWHSEKFTDVPFTGEITGREQGSFKNDKKEGAWVLLKEDGTVNEERTGTFKDGKKISD